SLQLLDGERSSHPPKNSCFHISFPIDVSSTTDSCYPVTVSALLTLGSASASLGRLSWGMRAGSSQHACAIRSRYFALTWLEGLTSSPPRWEEDIRVRRGRILRPRRLRTNT